jgi:glycerol-3-phosphate acyltransferase PlsY
MIVVLDKLAIILFFTYLVILTLTATRKKSCAAEFVLGAVAAFLAAVGVILFFLSTSFFAFLMMTFLLIAYSRFKEAFRLKRDERRQ